MNVTITWTPGDVESITDLPTEQAEEWLARNGKYLRDRSVEVGWNILMDLLHMDGIEVVT